MEYEGDSCANHCLILKNNFEKPTEKVRGIRNLEKYWDKLEYEEEALKRLAATFSSVKPTTVYGMSTQQVQKKK